MAYKHLEGQRFGRLTVLEFAGRSKSGEYLWRCRCDCGTIKEYKSRAIRSGLTKSCGCWKTDVSTERLRKHGLYHHPLYHIWVDIKGRCTCPTNYSYPYYGGRGITVCDEWLNDCKAFIDWSESHGWEKGLTIDRIDVNGPYSPDNCRWVSREVQANNMRSNHLITYKGKTQNLTQWAEELGMPASRLSSRICRGWDVERAFTEPKDPRFKDSRKPL